MCILGVDADSVIYKACGVTEKTVYDILPLTLPHEVDTTEYESYKLYVIQTFRYVKEYNDWLKSNKKTKEDFLRVARKEQEPLAHTLKIVNDYIKGIIDSVKPEQTYIFLSGKDNFREEIAFIREYKESRKDKVKPAHYQQCFDHIVSHWGGIVAKGEADDAVATLQVACLIDEQPSVLASIDKDLKMVPGWNYNFDKKVWTFITEEAAMRFFYIQLLTGDPTDSVPGCPGIGEKTAPKILEGCNTEFEMYEAVLKAYDKEYGNGKKSSLKLTTKVLIEQARLLWMQRYKDEMWLPPEREKSNG